MMRRVLVFFGGVLIQMWLWKITTAQDTVVMREQPPRTPQ